MNVKFIELIFTTGQISILKMCESMSAVNTHKSKLRGSVAKLFHHAENFVNFFRNIPWCLSGCASSSFVQVTFQCEFPKLNF